MFCSQCGTRLTPSARFCSECGAPRETPSQQQEDSQSQWPASSTRGRQVPSRRNSKESPPKPRTSRGLRPTFTGTLGCFIVLCVGLFVLGVIVENAADDKDSSTITRNTTSRPTPTPRPSKPPLEILSIDTKDAGIGDGSAYVYVDVVNHSDKLYSYVGIDATCRNSSGQVVATGLGNTANVASGERTTITVVMLAAQGCTKVSAKFDSLTGLLD